MWLVRNIVMGQVSDGPHSYLDCCDVCVLRRVLVVVQTILGSLSLSQVDTKLDEEHHDGLERGNGAVAGALRRDMFV